MLNEPTDGFATTSDSAPSRALCVKFGENDTFNGGDPCKGRVLAFGCQVCAHKNRGVVILVRLGNAKGSILQWISEGPKKRVDRAPQEVWRSRKGRPRRTNRR